MDSHVTHYQQNNPFAICNARAKELGWTPAETEECVLSLKKKMGIKATEPVASFAEMVEKFDYYLWPRGEAHPFVLAEDAFDPIGLDVLTFMAAPYSVYGGKRYLAAKVAALIPPHRRYVEPFAGAGSVMFAKANPSAEEVLTDIDDEKIHALGFLKTHQDGHRAALMKSTWTPNKEFFNRLKGAKLSDPTQRFHRFCYTKWNSFGNRGDSFCINTAAAQWQRYIGTKMSRFRDRLKSVKIQHMDWKKSIQTYDSPETFFYVDPPYIGTANARAAHFKEPSAQELAQVLRRVKGKFLMSNSDVPELHQAFKGCCIRKVNVPTRVDQVHAGSIRTRGETLIGNFAFHQPQTVEARQPGVAASEIIDPPGHEWLLAMCWACEEFHALPHE